MSGLEILGIAAAVLQIAELGGKLSVKLFTFSRKIKSADKSISSVSKDIAATGAVLQQLASVLKKDENLRLCSEQAVETAKLLVDECKKIFSELDNALDGNKSTGNKYISAWKEKLKYPFIEPQIELLQSNLERLKSSLIVMLNVLILAEQVRNQEALPILKEQRTLIGILVEDRNTSLKKFDQLQKAVEDGPKSSQAAANSEFSTTREEQQFKPAPFISTFQMDNPRREQEIEHHGSLIETLMNEISAGRYKINHGIRFRMHQGVLKAHWDEWSPLRKLYGDSKLMQTISLHSEVSQYWLSQLEAESTFQQSQDKRPIYIPDPPPSPPPGSVLPPPPERLNSGWQRQWDGGRHEGLIPPPPPPPNPYGSWSARSRPSNLPPPPPVNTEAITSATYIPGGDSFGPGVGVPPLDDYPPAYAPTVRRGDSRHHARVSPELEPRSISLIRSSTVPVIEPQQPLRERRPIVRKPKSPGANQQSQWTLDSILSWLAAKGFSSQWQETISELKIEGERFLELGTPAGNRIMYQTIYPSLAKSCTNSNVLWDQPKAREEGKRLRRLISQLPDRPSVDDHSDSDQPATPDSASRRRDSTGESPGTISHSVQTGRPAVARSTPRFIGFMEADVAFGPPHSRNVADSDSDSDSDDGLFAVPVSAQAPKRADEEARKDRPSLTIDSNPEYTTVRKSVTFGEDNHGVKVPRAEQQTLTKANSFDGPASRASRPSLIEILSLLDAFFPQADLDKPFDDANETKDPLLRTVLIPIDLVHPADGPEDEKGLLTDSGLKGSLRDVASKWRARSSIEATPTQAGWIASTSRLVLGISLGRGRWGLTRLGADISTGSVLVVKQKDSVDRYREKHDHAWTWLAKRLDDLRDLKHPALVQYLGSVHARDSSYNICVEYISGGSIGSLLRQHGKLEEPAVKSMTRQVLDGLVYLHRNKIIHGNLKADSVLIDLDGSCKLSDFGISEELKDFFAAATDDDGEGGEETITALNQFVFWTAPEVIQSPSLTTTSKADVWSLGCVVLEMFSGRRPWATSIPGGVRDKLMQGFRPPVQADVLHDMSTDALSFMYDCFEVKVHDRPTAESLDRHSLFCAREPPLEVRESSPSTGREASDAEAKNIDGDEDEVNDNDNDGSLPDDAVAVDEPAGSEKLGGSQRDVAGTTHATTDSPPGSPSDEIDALLLEWTTLSANELK